MKKNITLLMDVKPFQINIGSINYSYWFIKAHNSLIFKICYYLLEFRNFSINKNVMTTIDT